LGTVTGGGVFGRRPRKSGDRSDQPLQTLSNTRTTAMRILRVLDFEPVEESPRDDTGTEESLEE
jgi:hypothetical protein